MHTYPPTNTVTNPLPQQSPMITLHSIDRKLDTFKQTLDTIKIKQDQYHFIQHQSNFTAPIRLPTDSNLRYNTPQSHYINNRILHHAIINKLTSPKTKSSFSRTTNKYELRKITSDGKTDWISNPVMYTSKDFDSWTKSYKSYTDLLLHPPTTSKLPTRIQQLIASQLPLSSQLPSVSQPISPNNNK